jgi:DNA repair protein RecN (Recombination protein N)
MLQKLTIQNYAIIAFSEITFTDQLNIITGETGAGKSIIMGALSLILGERADSSILLDKSKKMIVEAVFDFEPGSLLDKYLDTAGFDRDQELIIRREMGANGKSRAFVNDSPASIQQLQFIGSQLVDLHQQFDTLSISSTSFQQSILDALANNQALYQDYQQDYQSWINAKSKLSALQEQILQQKKEWDYLQFLYQELEEAAFQTDEIERTENELAILAGSEQINAGLEKIVFEVLEAPQSIAGMLKQQLQQLQSYKQNIPALAELLDRLQATHVEIAEIARDAQRLTGHLHTDPAKQQQLEERINLGYKLLKKHQVQHTNELLATQESLLNRLQATVELDEALTETTKLADQLELTARQKAQKLSKERKKITQSFEESVRQLLSQVGMKSAQLQVSITATDTLNAFGIDQIDFLFDANNSGNFAPVRKVASGGELSRLMLCIKSLVAASMHMPTLIFDEIDSGISGEAAKQAGHILKKIASTHQLICITHQPQIAGRADAHFFVYKEANSGRSNTNIRPLEKEERVLIIAQMMSGEKPSAAALANARELIEQP